MSIMEMEMAQLREAQKTNPSVTLADIRRQNLAPALAKKASENAAYQSAYSSLTPEQQAQVNAARQQAFTQLGTMPTAGANEPMVDTGTGPLMPASIANWQTQRNQVNPSIANMVMQMASQNQSGGGGSFGGLPQNTSSQYGFREIQDPTKYTANPALGNMANSITSQVTENLNRNILPGITSAAVSTGGYGGSRQGVVEANALRDVNRGLSDSLTNMYYGDYNNAMNRNMGRYQLDSSYNQNQQQMGQNFTLGLGNLGLNAQNSMQNFYTAQRGQDLQQTALGANLFNQGTTGMLNQGQGIYNLGLTAQQAPWQTLTGFANVSSPYTGYGSTTQQNNGSSGAGFLGGAIGATQLYNLWR